MERRTTNSQEVQCWHDEGMNASDSIQVKFQSQQSIVTSRQSTTSVVDTVMTTIRPDTKAQFRSMCVEKQGVTSVTDHVRYIHGLNACVSIGSVRFTSESYHHHHHYDEHGGCIQQYINTYIVNQGRQALTKIQGNDVHTEKGICVDTGSCKCWTVEKFKKEKEHSTHHHSASSEHMYT